MSNFNNETFKALVEDIINDTFYMNSSLRGKTARIRQYAEVVIRKILDYSDEEFLTLGHKKITAELRKKKNNDIIFDAINVINKYGSSSIHTQHVKDITLKNYEDSLDALFDLFAFLLIDYFEKYEFGSQPRVVYAFSILPPIIRYKTLNALYINPNHKDNIEIIDKLCLAILKAFDFNTAYDWVEMERASLIKKKTISKKFEIELRKKMEDDVIDELLSQYPNMYDLCKDKILKVGLAIQENGRLYDSFESALPYYKEKGIIQGSLPEIKEFNSIMEFLYMGRKKDMTRVFNSKDSYMILNYFL